MKHLVVIGLFFAVGVQVSLADDTKVTDEEAAKVQDVLKLWGCTDGEVSHAKDGHFRVEDAQCSSGEYDFYISRKYVVKGVIQH